MTFQHILGHDRQKAILRRAISSGRLAHAYMFEGLEGVGKRLMALALTRAIFCKNGTGCGDCSACKKVDHNNHPDLHFFEPEGSNYKIEQIRGFQKEFAYRPIEAPKKVFLLDRADRMNPASGNALLKTLEEPPGEALIILLTARPEAVLETIRSRCQRLPFARLPQELLQRALLDHLGVDETEGHILAALSEGSFNKALGNNRELYLIKRKDILKELTALSAGSALPLFSFSQALADDKEHLPEILELFQAFYRDLLIYLHGRPEKELVNIDLLDKIRRIAQRETIPSLLKKLDAISQCIKQLDRNVNKQLAMDVLLMRLTLIGT